ncbi:hypothetical protein EBB54_12715 [Schaedlerella arabinosiphila]|uniref:Uncharacterized protein n=1 Tax=Schaedlerella arabinosiphila TaxID=2044587 RepID=A0A426DHD9_9FIRM|nr:hypothetical protein EBB54_12715 [Schaedlerella arabinosiphila]
MRMIVSPYDEQLKSCLNSQDALEEKLAVEKEKKNALIVKMENFYTDKLKEIYFKSGVDGSIGQISYVFAKAGKLFVHLYFLEITANSKLIKKYTNIELFGKEMEKLTELTEAEYQGEFFAYVDKQIRMVEDRHEESGK